MDFAVPADHRVKLKEKNDKYLDLSWELKKLWNMNVRMMAIVIGTLITVTQWLIRGPVDLEIRGRAETIQNYCFTEIGQNTQTNPADLRRLAVAQTSVKDHDLTLMWKTFKEEK